MKILVLNCGSSSVKYQLCESGTEEVITKGLVEKIGTKSAIHSFLTGSGEKEKQVTEIFDHQQALTIVIKTIVNPEYNIIKDESEIKAVGHRVVHGGEEFFESVLINEDVIEKISDCIELAPLHNPANLTGIRACQKVLPDTPMVAVFDTAFHQTMPDYAFLYGLPYTMYRQNRIRRYGFHGTSHKYVAAQAAEILEKPLSECNLITCHLGNGASIAAIQNGKSVDTSMGFTPLEGLVMGTRSGDIDPAILLYVMSKEELSATEVNSMLNKHSGLLGISGYSNDMRKLREASAEGNSQAETAIKIFAYRIKKYIGSYMAVLGNVDAVIFTAGIGENEWPVRARILSDLAPLGIVMNSDKNQNNEKVISTQDSKIKIFVIPTNEELVIMRDTLRIVDAL